MAHGHDYAKEKGKVSLTYHVYEILHRLLNLVAL